MATSSFTMCQETSCPFCQLSFRGLGNHLRHCKQRQGRDYRQYLAPKTLSKSQPRRKMQCPSCEKYFVRLDTHLRRSTVCRSIPPLPSPSPPLPVTDSVLCDSVGSQPQPGEAAIFLTPLNLNSASQAPAASGETTNNIPALSPLPAMKQRLILPRTTEGWNAANEHFNNILVPAVLGASSLSEKYSILMDGIYAYFQSSYGSTAAKPSPPQKRRPLHKTSLKEVTKQKKRAKLELRRACQQGFPPESIQSLAQQFLALVRSHSQLKRSADFRSAARSVKDARNKCHHRFTAYVKELLDGGPSGNIAPSFDAVRAHSFSEVYHSDPQIFSQPDWLPSPPAPQVEMDCSPFSIQEVSQVLKRIKATSAPSPFDRVGYIVFKKCPALIPALVSLFNLCWVLSGVPHQRRTAAIKLIPKGPAAENASDPANFRPIVLTPCVGKIFTTLLRNWWLKFMLLNKYFNPSLQKAFLPNIPGCTEHQLKLSSILNEAQGKHKALAVC